MLHQLARTHPHSGELCMWTFSDIAREPYGSPTCRRPLVHFQAIDEAVEKMTWCYENGALPLLAEKKPDICIPSIRAYEVDSLLCDALSFGELIPILQTQKKLTHISIVDSRFDQGLMDSVRTITDSYSFVLSCAPLGPIAVSNDGAIFSIVPEAEVTIKDGTMCAQKTSRSMYGSFSQPEPNATPHR